MIISNVDRSDQAIYACVAENQAGKAEKKTRLRVLGR